VTDRDTKRVDGIEQRLCGLEDLFRQHTADEEEIWAVVTHRLESVDEHLVRLVAEVGPKLPDPMHRGQRDTLQSRLHKVESDRAAIEMLGQRFEERIDGLGRTVSRLDRAAQRQEDVNEANARRWGRWRVIVITVCAIIGGFSALIAAVAASLKLFGITAG